MSAFKLDKITDRFSAGFIVIAVLAVVSTLIVLNRKGTEIEGMEFWVFADLHYNLYKPVTDHWRETGEENVTVLLLEGQALERRMMSSFFTGTPIADLLEVHTGIAKKAWRGPIEAVGFTDLTDILHETGLYEMFNEPSFSGWTAQGHIFGLPHDVHPVLLTYRSDIVEAAGINVDELDTWDKFMEAMRPLVKDLNGDGRPDQFVLEMPETNGGIIVPLIMQAGGDLFDTEGNITVDTELNARVLSKFAVWAAAGPGKLSADKTLNDGPGRKLQMDGYVLAWLTPDWRAGSEKAYMEVLSGKLKLMPLPAWEEGGRRTTVMGGTMIGIPKSNPHPDDALRVAVKLYSDREIARGLFRIANIISPVKTIWDDPIYDQPDPFYSNQPNGRLFVNQAPNVPIRSSSPFLELATDEVGIAFSRLIQHAGNAGITDPEALIPEAHRLLKIAHENVARQVDRDVFLKKDES
ncbi:MAG: extracellular solute-binding protein [Opitutaceae bacterium]